MTRIMIPSTGPDAWKALLADPEKQWKTGFSARTLAHCWEAADGFPPCVKKVLNQTEAFEGISMLLGLPEHKVPLASRRAASQNDLWVLAGCASGLVSIAVEGKVSESFGPTIGEWDWKSSPGKEKRLKLLCQLLDLDFPPDDALRYQLFHRTVSAIITAQLFDAEDAIMLVHSFSPTHKRFNDYQAFAAALGATAKRNQLVNLGERSEVQLWLGWVCGEAKWLEA
jgi:Domain of unknown function (DUF6946)